MLNRILKFDTRDWKHMRFLFLNMLNQLFIKFDYHEAKESYIWMKIHISYDSKSSK